MRRDFIVAIPSSIGTNRHHIRHTHFNTVQRRRHIELVVHECQLMHRFRGMVRQSGHFRLVHQRSFDGHQYILHIL